MDNASGERLPYSNSTRSPSLIPQVAEREKNDDVRSTVPVYVPVTTPASGTTTESTNKSPSTLAASPAPSQSSDKAWSKSKPLSPEEILLHPIMLSKLPPPQADAPLFLPADADRLWYTGFVKPWKDFTKSATELWYGEACLDGFAALADHPMIPGRIGEHESELVKAGDGAGILQASFQREVLDPMQKIFIRLSEEEIFPPDGPEEIWLGDIDDGDLGNAEQKWDPSYIIKGARDAQDESLRVLGQVEYLGGKPGALTAAVKDLTKNSWGSLRCVLGKIAQSMLISSTRHAFLISADEIMFLRFDLVEKVDYNTRNGEAVDLFVEPWLTYSQPIRFSATFDEEGEIPLKVALLYLYACAMEKDFELQGEIGNSLKYFAKTKVGKKYLPSFPWMKK